MEPKNAPCPVCGKPGHYEEDEDKMFCVTPSCPVYHFRTPENQAIYAPVPPAPEVEAAPQPPKCPECGYPGKLISGQWYCLHIGCKMVYITPTPRRPEPKPKESTYPAPSCWVWHDYTVYFTRHRDVTVAVIFDGGKVAGTGAARRNPKDTQDAKVGDRWALRRACCCEELRPLYDAFRSWQYEELWSVPF